MTLRERIVAVYRGETPDVVPFVLDLSHWFYWKERRPWDLSLSYAEPERALIDYHRHVGAGFYMPNLGAFHASHWPEGVRSEVTRSVQGGQAQIAWRLETPQGAIERARRWEERTYAWGISRWGIRTEADLRVFACAMGGRRYTPLWGNWRAWDEYVGDLGVVYLPAGYSAMGHLLHYWMGVEQVAYAAADCPGALQETVETVNANNLEMIDLLCASPAQVVIMGDNFSSDVQPPHFFARYSAPYYRQAVARLHAAGKRVAVHIDGKLRGALAMVAATGADAGDAITPGGIGGLSAAQCRQEAGPDFVLSGGVSPELWLPDAPLAAFDQAVLAWLELRRQSPRLLAAAGDQVPPGADETRMRRMRDLVEECGRF
ncbi:MAG: uroporphyrinogen decarboxylase family protein [Candidatus Latescibacterota bacterium]